MTSQSRSLVASALAGGLLLAGVGSIPFIVGPQEAEARPAIRRDSFVAAAVKRSGPAVVTLETARTVNQSGAVERGMPKKWRNMGSRIRAGGTPAAPD